MRPKEIYESTTNRAVYNKVRKLILEKNGLIRCHRCGYHRGENDEGKYYIVYEGEQIDYCNSWWRSRRPNWKLTSKNPKQWMDKGLKFKKYSYNRDYNNIDYLSREDFEIKW